MAALSNLLRRLGDGDNMEGCFASAGRGLGQTLRSVEDYVSEVFQRGVCYIDNTLEDRDEEYTVQKKELTNKDGSPCDDHLDKDSDNNEEGTQLQSGSLNDNSLRHRSKQDRTSSPCCSQAALESEEVWDVPGSKAAVSYWQTGALACAPLVDVEASPDDMYRLSTESDVYRLSAESSVIPKPSGTTPLQPHTPDCPTTAQEGNDSAGQDTLEPHITHGVQCIDELAPMLDVQLI